MHLQESTLFDLDHTRRCPVPSTSCGLCPKVKVKGQILNFLVNASPPKPFDVATSNFVAEKVA